MSSVDHTPIPLQTGAMLRWAWDAFTEELLAGAAAAGFGDLRPIHRAIVRDLLFDSQRPTQLAARLGLSKQTVNDLLREFEAKGYIALEPDPDDRRAKRIVPTDRGWEFGQTTARLSRAISRRWAAQVGEERYAVFEEVLREIAIQARARLDPPPHPGRAERPAPNPENDSGAPSV